MTGTGITAPPEEIIRFGPGAELSVELTCGEAQMGTYTLRLWTPDGLTVVRKARGSFMDEVEDRYALLSPPDANAEHLLQCRARVWLIQGHRKYAVFMTVKQGATVIGEASEVEQTDEPTVVVDLRARLRRA
ncbi:MAG: hypothetical protein U0104_08300 [Gemmatimonadales bacterium]|nr:hypothetical protein [Gemmatimonadales bacterium]